MLLRLNPGLVKEHTNVPAVDPGNPFLPAHRAWIIPDRTADGHIGSPHAASAEKGEQLFELFSGGLAELLQRVLNWDGSSWDG